jgi:hypothetical protein
MRTPALQHRGSLDLASLAGQRLFFRGIQRRRGEIGMAPGDDDPVEVYRREIADVVPLTKEEAAHLFQEARKSGDPGEPANISCTTRRQCS